MERLRWITRDLPSGRFVLVNVAGFLVYVIDDGKIIWNSRVVVGKPYTSTPIFRDEIEYVVINPTWTVPASIVRNEMQPAMRRDPGYLERKGLTMVNGRIVQPPGDNNALGRIKIMFPNEHSVYLHDTPAKSLFERDVRAFSHGCMRVEDPFTLGSLVIDDPQWTREKIMSRIAANLDSETIYLKRKVPVLVLYATALVGPESGRVYFYDDIYQRDPRILKALDERFELHEADRVKVTASR
jgi:murein L,D-transpeptidase YcbB/YkuD